MSFKLMGDAYDDYNRYNKDRMRELLSNNIPMDEARKERNGRYLCLVCPYFPLFDNMPMLTIHRRGKKHLRFDKEFHQKKMEREEKKMKATYREYKNDIVTKKSTPIVQEAKEAIAEIKKMTSTPSQSIEPPPLSLSALPSSEIQHHNTYPSITSYTPVSYSGNHSNHASIPSTNTNAPNNIPYYPSHISFGPPSLPYPLQPLPPPPFPYMDNYPTNYYPYPSYYPPGTMAMNPLKNQSCESSYIQPMASTSRESQNSNPCQSTSMGVAIGSTNRSAAAPTLPSAPDVHVSTNDPEAVTKEAPPKTGWKSNTNGKWAFKDPSVEVDSDDEHVAH